MCANHNRAIEESRREFVYLLQDDDVAEPHLARKVREAIMEHEGFGMLIFSTVLFDSDGGGQRVFWEPPRAEVVEPPDGLIRFAADWRISIVEVVFARRLFDRYGGFDPELPIMSDAEMILRWLVHTSALLLPDALARRRNWSGQYTAATSASPEMQETMAGLARKVEHEAMAGGVSGEVLEALRASLKGSFVDPYRFSEPGETDRRSSLGEAVRKWLLG
jgi:hypothetical protein